MLKWMWRVESVFTNTPANPVQYIWDFIYHFLTSSDRRMLMLSTECRMTKILTLVFACQRMDCQWRSQTWAYLGSGPSNVGICLGNAGSVYGLDVDTMYSTISLQCTLGASSGVSVQSTTTYGYTLTN